MIKVKDLRKSFGKLEVLKGISEEIKEQEVVCRRDREKVPFCAA